MTEQGIEMEEITEEVVDLMDVQLTDDIIQMKCLICESRDSKLYRAVPNPGAR
jgi:hypothetical protein